MFTGIVEEVGKVINLQNRGKSSVLEISGNIIFNDIKIGDSIAVNGVCLTVTNFSNNIFCCDVMEVTLASSSIGMLTVGSLVNLERAMPANGRFGGHIVSGHIDGTGIIATIQPGQNSVLYSITTSQCILKYIINKGSIAIDGISLTVTNVWEDGFSVSLIPHTSQATTLSNKSKGDTVNLENDLIGKYIERILSFEGGNKEPKSNITKEFLTKFGYL